MTRPSRNDPPAGLRRASDATADDVRRILEYQNYIRDRMSDLVRIVGKVAAGDFSDKPEIVERDDDELAQFVVGFRFMLEDLEHSQAEQRNKAKELEEAYERVRFQATLLTRQSEASPDGILVVDPEGKILSYNRRFVEMWGIPDEVIRTGSDEKALASVQDKLADPDEFLSRVKYLYEHPEEESQEEVRLKDGRVFDRHSAPIEAVGGHQYGRVWYFRDVSKDKAAEQELRDAYERLKELSTMKTNFINTVAHELATPLTPLKLQLAVLEGGQSEGLTEQQGRSVALLRRNVDRLVSMVHDVLDVARLEAGRLPVNLRELDLRTVVTETVETYEAAAEDAGVRLAVSDGGEIPVRADGLRMAQVMQNLLSNAVKFTPRGGTVRVDWHTTDDEVFVRVRDSGVGLAEEDFAGLFQPFSQVHDPMQHTRSGTGLGLYITHGIVERHGGQLSADSPGRGHGATFTVRLPLAGPGDVDDGGSPRISGRSRRGSECPRCGSRDLLVRVIKDRTRCNACDHEWS